MNLKTVLDFSKRLSGLAGPAIIVLASVVAVAPLLFIGPSCRSDFGFHLVSWMDAGRSLAAGIPYPHWANSPNFGAGEPKFVFYPPITWMMGAVLGMILPWSLVPFVLFVVLLAATGMATRALARMALEDGAATLAGCAAIFIGYALFNVYRRDDFSEMTGGFWIPLLLLFLLRRGNRAGNFLERTFDGSAVPLALVVAGMWLSSGPLGIMGSYLLAAVALVRAALEKSLAPIVRASASTAMGMGLASFYLIPAIWESKWINIGSAVRAGEYWVENNWLFGLDADPRVAARRAILF